MPHLRDLIEQEIAALRQIPLDGGIERAVEVLYECVHQKDGKVIVSGVGKAGQIGMKLATTLSSTGTAACFLSPLEAQHGDLGILQPHDVLILISNSGQTREMLELAALAEHLYPTISIIVMTKNPKSELVNHAKAVLLTGDTKEICPLGLTPTTSTTVMAVISDLVTVLLMEKIGFTKEDYALRHHSGYLGQQAKKS